MGSLLNLEPLRIGRRQNDKNFLELDEIDGGSNGHALKQRTRLLSYFGNNAYANPVAGRFTSLCPVQDSASARSPWVLRESQADVLPYAERQVGEPRLLLSPGHALLVSPGMPQTRG